MDVREDSSEIGDSVSREKPIKFLKLFFASSAVDISRFEHIHSKVNSDVPHNLSIAGKNCV